MTNEFGRLARFFLPAVICLLVLGDGRAQERKGAAAKPVVTAKREVGSFQVDKPFGLAQLIDLALRNNPSTRGAWQNAMAAEAVTGQARAPYYPQIRAKFEGGIDQGYAPNATGPNNFTRAKATPSIVLEYLLLDFGRRDADLQRTLHALAAADLSYNRKMQETIFAVQGAYFGYNAALSEQAAAAENEELSQTVLAMVGERMKAGLATQPEMLDAKKMLARAQYDSEDAVRKIKTTLGRLRTVAGVEANASLAIEAFTPPSSYAVLQGKLDALIDKAVVSRPDLAARIADLRASEEATRRAQADFFPKVRFEAGYENINAKYHAKDGRTKGTYEEHGTGYAVGIVAEWDIFDGFARVEKVKQRRAEQEAARAEADASRLNVVLDVWTSYYEVATARRRVDFAESLLVSSKEVRDATKASYQAGLATITELIGSQSDLAAARYMRADADADYLTAVASLAFAMGADIRAR